MTIKTFITSVIICSSLAGCTGVTNTDAGTVSGAAIGGLVGSRFGHGTGRVLATTVGGLTGALIGNRIGGEMDRADRRAMQEAFEDHPDKQPKVWVNPNNGNRFRVTPTRTFYRQSQPCREYTTTAIIGGKKEQIYGTACRTDDGGWKVTSSR